jgi:predicted lipoprotein
MWAAAAIVAIVVCCLWPPFTVVSLQNAREAEAKATFNPEQFAQAIWDNEFSSLANAAPNIGIVAQVLDQNPDEAISAYGKTWGLGGSTYFTVEGEGRVTAIHKDKIDLEVEGMPPGVNVVLLTDRIFGNTVRNASGLVNPSDFPNSQDLNSVSIALNNLVMSGVLVPLRYSAKVDDLVRFLGCIEIRSVTSISNFAVVPIAASVIPDDN